MRCRRDHCYWPVSFSITVLQVGVAALKAGLFESAWICCRDADEFAAALLGSGKLIPCWRMQAANAATSCTRSSRCAGVSAARIGNASLICAAHALVAAWTFTGGTLASASAIFSTDCRVVPGSGTLIPWARMQRTAARRAGRSLTAFGVVVPADRAWIDVELELELELPQALIVRAAAAAITASVLSFIPGPVRGRG